MKTEELIADLAGRLAPLRPLPSPGWRALRWAAVAIPLVAAAAVMFGPRADLGDRLVHIQFAWTLVVAATAASLAAVSALILAVPGAERSVVIRAAALSLVALWGLGLGAAAAADGAGIANDTHWLSCFLRAVVVGTVAAAVLGVLVRRAAALSPRLTGLLVAVAGTATATIAVQIACPIDGAGHALAGHFAPVVAMAALGVIVGRRLLSSGVGRLSDAR